jgi:tRNA(Arg) A34 adenosine deaminase TadA
MNDLRFLRQAILLAGEHSSAGTGGPFGAVVTRGREVVGQGWNQVVMAIDPTAHAEILAIRAAAERLGTHILDNCVIHCSCEPCPMCLSAIYWARIPRVVFAASGEDAAAAGFDDTAIARELELGWAIRGVKSVQELREEGKAILQKWAENPHRERY